MAESETSRIALKFVNEINRHDVESVLAMIPEDHVMVDSLGQESRGKERARDSWSDCFRSFPDYHLGVREWFQNGRVVGMFGVASGTRAVGTELPVENRWRFPAAWRVVVRDHLIAHWQVYADYEPLWKALGVKRY